MKLLYDVKISSLKEGFSHDFHILIGRVTQLAPELAGSGPGGAVRQAVPALVSRIR